MVMVRVALGLVLMLGSAMRSVLPYLRCQWRNAPFFYDGNDRPPKQTPVQPREDVQYKYEI